MTPNNSHIPVNLAQQLLEFLGERARDTDAHTVLGTLQDAIQDHREGRPRKQMRTQLHRDIASFLKEKQTQYELSPEQVRGATMLAITAAQKAIYGSDNG